MGGEGDRRIPVVVRRGGKHLPFPVEFIGGEAAVPGVVVAEDE
jgi:hypothetical protein